jgi:hypothetical protein
MGEEARSHELVRYRGTRLTWIYTPTLKSGRTSPRVRPAAFAEASAMPIRSGFQRFSFTTFRIRSWNRIEKTHPSNLPDNPHRYNVRPPMQHRLHIRPARKHTPPLFQKGWCWAPPSLGRIFQPTPWELCLALWWNGDGPLDCHFAYLRAERDPSLDAPAITHFNVEMSASRVGGNKSTDSPLRDERQQ